MNQVDVIEAEFAGKTPSLRMRNVLFIIWKQVPEGFKEFDSFYKFKMEKYIDELKANLP
jgi:hypothetical protein